MDTLKLIINISPFEPWVCDVLMAELANVGFDSFVETETGFEAFIPVNLFDSLKLESVRNNLPVGFDFEFQQEIIPACNWNEEWEKNYFKPLVISDKVVVRAPFHTQYPACTYEIIIEPNMAFGTGNHETTSLMMETMLHMELSGKSLLDMGCGTGILAILAAKLGAAPITAIDVDEWSYRATLENAQLNQVSGIKTLKGDASLLGNETYDIVLANIQKNIILADLHRYNAVLNKGGQILVSGFYENDLTDIRREALSDNLIFGGFWEKNNWVVALFRKE